MTSILKWMATLTVLLGVTAGAGAYWFYVHSDEILRTGVLAQLEHQLPDVRWRIERAQIDFSGRVRLYGLSIQLPDEAEESLYVPETVATLDQQQLTDFKNATIQRLKFVRPELRVVRYPDGKWNWQGLQVRKGPAGVLPDIEIHDGTVVIQTYRDQTPMRPWKLYSFHLTSRPNSMGRAEASVTTRVKLAGMSPTDPEFDPAGPLVVNAEFDLNGPPWKVDSTWKQLPIDDGLLRLIGQTLPAIGKSIDDVRYQLAEWSSTQAASSPIRIADETASPVNDERNNSRTANVERRPATLRPMDLGVKCVCDVHTRLEQKSPDDPVQAKILTDITSGQINNALLPFPMQEVTGSIFVDNRRVIVRNLVASNGSSSIRAAAETFDGSLTLADVKADGIEIDDAVKVRLPEQLRRLVKSMELTGICNIHAWKNTDPDANGWDADVVLTKGTVTHEKFPYPVRDAEGTVQLRKNVATINGKGRASGATCLLDAKVIDPGPGNGVVMTIKTTPLPIDDVLLKACPPEIRKTVNQLNLMGRCQANLEMTRPRGPGKKLATHLKVALQNCSISFNGFPYNINRLTGLVDWKDDLVTFSNLRGEHDGAIVTGNGTYLRIPAPGRLNLAINVESGAFDRSLEGAVPPNLRTVWNELQPQGEFDAESLIRWVPGQPCEIELPRISVGSGSITLAGFPWPLHDLAGELSYAAPELKIRSFSTRHDDTRIRGRGVAIVSPDARWVVRFDELNVDDLTPNASFRKALPTQLRKVVETLNPTGKFSFSSTGPGSVELQGPTSPGKAISSKWNLRTTMTGCAMTAGIRIEDIHGHADVAGRFDGEQTTMNGRLDLDSISVFRQPSGLAHQITKVRGPIHLNNGQFVAGAPAVVTIDGNMVEAQDRTPVVEQISGDMIGGQLVFDAAADVRQEPVYRACVSLHQGRLERYAQQYMPGQSNLAGIMNGAINLWGNGTSTDNLKGDGYLRIAPAALYELPLFVQMFRLLPMDVGDRTAFDRATLVYDISSSRFNFRQIDLAGNALRLQGQGNVRFDGAMNINFYAVPARNQIRIPVLTEIAGMISKNAVGIRVGGTVSAPITRTVAAPELDDAFRQMLESWEPQPLRRNASIRQQNR